MSSIQRVPVEILLDIFRADDVAGTETLRLTCRRFNAIILENADTLPARLVFDLHYSHYFLRLYRAPANDGSTRDEDGRETRKPIASGSFTPKGLRHMYEAFGRTTAIRKACTAICGQDRPGDSLKHLLKNFPSVKYAVSLDIKIEYGWDVPTDVVLDRFERLETLGMFACVHDTGALFWRKLFAISALGRVSTVIIRNHRNNYPAVDDRQMFDFITDFSLMPAGAPRVVFIRDFDVASFNALERRFDENIASIDGRVCAVIMDRERVLHYLTNMTLASRKEAVAKHHLYDFCRWYI